MELKNLLAQKNRLGNSGRPARAGRVSLTVLLAVPVFFLFVYLNSRAGYEVFNYRPYNLFPPIPVYLADYSLCFSSRLLIGSVTKLFSYHITLGQIYDICVTMNIVALAVVSLITGALLRRGIEARSFFVLFLTLLFVMDPVVPQENYPAIGSYDTYWLVLFAVLLVLCRTYGFAVAAPFFCFTGMLVHYGFLFTFLPCIAALLVYDLFNAEKKGKRVLSGVSLGVTGVSSGAILIWSFFFQNKHLKMTGPEFHEYMLSRLVLTFGEKGKLQRLFGANLFPYDFFEIYFFSNRDGAELKPITPDRFLEIFHNYLKEMTSAEYYLKYAAMLLPFFFILAVFWLVCAKKAKGAKKLPFICFAGIESVFFAACVFSTDLYRYGAAAMIAQVALMTGMFVKKDGTFRSLLDAPLFRKKWFIALALLAGAAYIALLLKFGVHLPRTPDR